MGEVISLGRCEQPKAEQPNAAPPEPTLRGPSDCWVTTRKLGREMGWSTKAVRRLADRYRLPYAWASGWRVYRASDLQAMLDAERLRLGPTFRAVKAGLRSVKAARKNNAEWAERTAAWKAAAAAKGATA